MHNLKATEFCSIFIRQQVKQGDICIDATAGRGHDTLLLSFLCGKSGRVYAFDLQEDALTSAAGLLKEQGAPDNVTLLHDSHTNMDQYVQPGTVSCIVFNLGYLPGGDHSIATRASTTLPALAKAFGLLKTGGLLSVCIYSGKDSGFEEKDAVLSFLENLDPRKFLVIRSDFLNRPSNPPIPVIVIRLS